jgi:hypothetical protein
VRSEREERLQKQVLDIRIKDDSNKTEIGYSGNAGDFIRLPATTGSF